MLELNIRAKKVTSKKYNELKENPSFLTLNEDESTIEFFKANLLI